MTKKFVWFGLFIGSTIGSLLPAMWGDDMFSVSSFVLSIAGGVAGIWVGYRVGQSL